MINKKILLLVFTAIFLISFLSMTNAAISLSVANRSNISGSYLLNASITGLTGNVEIKNVSFYYQIFGGSTWTLINTAVENTSINQSYFSTTWDTVAVADGRNYTLNVTSRDYNAGTVNATNITVSVTIDNTAPTIAVYGTAPTAYANGTSIKTSTSSANNLTLSIYVTDTTIGIANNTISACYVNTGDGINHTIPMFSTGLTTGWCNASDTNASTAMNISGLADGNKTINIYINDSRNNMELNNTLVVQIDTTKPTATARCSPTTVNTGDTFPCTCSGADVTSGVKTNTGTSTSGSVTSTSKTGTFTYTCSVEDNAAWTETATKAYSVEQFSSSHPSGTTSSAWTATQTISEGIFANGYTAVLGAKTRLKVSVDSADHYIGVVSISGNEATIEISSNPIQVTLSAGQEKKVDVTNDSFYDISVLMNGITNNKANITVMKIHEEILPAETEQAAETPGEGTSTGTSGSLTWLWVLIAIIVLIIIGSVISKSKRKKKSKVTN